MQDFATECAALNQMTTGDLAKYYAELHGHPCRTRHKAYLIRKIAWRLQANAEGDLSERARQRAAELANDADVRVMAPRTMVCPPQVGESAVVTKPVKTVHTKPIDPRLPAPGSANRQSLNTNLVRSCLWSLLVKPSLLSPESSKEGFTNQLRPVVRNFRLTAADGKQYETKHYNLDARHGIADRHDYIQVVITDLVCMLSASVVA